MAFRREYGKVSDVANLAAKAGAAVQEVQNRKAELDMLKFQLAQTAQKESELRAIQHSINTQQFEADLQFEARKAQRAWELEKEMLRSKTQFDLQLQQEMQYSQLQNQKLQAVQDAYNNGQISEEDMTALKLKVQTGVIPPSLEARRGTPSDDMEALLSQMLGKEPTSNPPTQNLIENRPTSPEDGVPYSTITMADGTKYQYKDGKLIGVAGPQKDYADMSLEELMNVEIPEQPGQLQAEEIQKQAVAPAYARTGWGIFGKTRANIPAMKAKLATAMDAPQLGNAEKMALQRVVSSGNPEAIQAYYEKLVEVGFLPKEYPVKESQMRQIQGTNEKVKSIFNPEGTIQGKSIFDKARR